MNEKIEIATLAAYPPKTKKGHKDMNTKETRRTFTATEIPADQCPYTWDDFITDDFRLWEVITSEHLRIQEHGKTALISAAVEASRFAIDEMASAWQFGETFIDLFHDVWQEAQEWQGATGCKWEHSPEWRKAAHEVHEVMQGFGVKGYEPYGEIDKAELAAAILTCATGNAWGVATIRGYCFTRKPAPEVLERIKARRCWRWSKFSKCWYTRANETERAFAHELAQGVK